MQDKNTIKRKVRKLIRIAIRNKLNPTSSKLTMPMLNIMKEKKKESLSF